MEVLESSIFSDEGKDTLIEIFSCLCLGTLMDVARLGIVEIVADPDVTD